LRLIKLTLLKIITQGKKAPTSGVCHQWTQTFWNRTFFGVKQTSCGSFRSI